MTDAAQAGPAAVWGDGRGAGLSPHRPGGLLALFDREMRPYDGRLYMSVHIACLCALTAVVAMTLRVPEALLACYLIFFAYKDNAGEAISLGLQLLGAATVGIFLGIILLMAVADAPMLRLALILLITFGGMFMWRASNLGPGTYALACVFAFILMLGDNVPVQEFLVRGIMWLWVVVAIPMLLLVFSNILFGRSPRALAQRRVSDRLEAAADLLEGRGEDPAELLEAGNNAALGYVRMAQLMGELRGTEPTDRLTAEIVASSRILIAAAALAEAGALSGADGADEAEPGRGAPRARQAAMLRALAAGEPLPTAEAESLRAAATGPDAGGALADGIAALAAARDPDRAPPRPVPPAERVEAAADVLEDVGQDPIEVMAAGDPLLKPDAFTNPIYVQFALKVTLAVAITYIFVLWTGRFATDIHTAMITCFFVAIGTGGETFHKSALRIIGCLIGAMLGYLAVRFLVPHLTDAGGLFALIFAGSFIAAWVTLGSWRVEYLGWQIGLAYFIAVLPASPLDFGPSIDPSDAGYRILGIITGLVVMAIVFSLIWPESSEVTLAEETEAALRDTAKTLRGTDRAQEAQVHLGNARIAAEVMNFERLGAYRARSRRATLRQRLAVAQALARLAPALAGRPGAAQLAAEVEAVADRSRWTDPAHRSDLDAQPVTQHPAPDSSTPESRALAQAQRLLRIRPPRETAP